MKLKAAVRKFLKVIEEDAKYSYSEWHNGQKQWSETIWKRHDPEYYKHWRRITDLVNEPEEREPKHRGRRALSSPGATSTRDL